MQGVAVLTRSTVVVAAGAGTNSGVGNSSSISPARGRRRRRFRRVQWLRASPLQLRDEDGEGASIGHRGVGWEAVWVRVFTRGWPWRRLAGGGRRERRVQGGKDLCAAPTCSGAWSYPPWPRNIDGERQGATRSTSNGSAPWRARG